MALRVSVVGVGSMGRNHARVLAELGVLHAVADQDAARARDVARAHGVAAVPVKQALDADAVVLATPTAMHHEQALASLERGVHVLVEKPLAESAAKARDLVRRAAKASVVLAVGHVERHNPVVAFARETLASGAYGRLITAHARRVSNFPGRVRDVGCLMDIGIHDLDVVRHLAGEEVTRVYCSAGTVTEGLAFEDHATVLLTFRSGVSGVVECNWLTPRKVRTLTLTCTKGLVELDYMEQGATLSSSTFREVTPGNLFDTAIDVHAQQVRLKREEPLRRELVDFLAACESGRAPLVGGDDGVAALDLAEAALRSHATKREVEVAR